MTEVDRVPVVLNVEDVVKVYEPPPWWLRPLIRTAAREPVEAVGGVSFQVRSGEIVGLVGPNGAGKTTLIRIIATLLEPSGGRVTIRGTDIAANPARARHSIGLVLSDDRGLYWRLTGLQNLEFFGVMAGLPPATARARAAELLETVGLRGRDKLVFGYSAGMRTRLNVARALLAQPELLLLDEPSRGLDPVASRQLADILRTQAQSGRAILLSSHRLDEIAEVCDTVVALIGGDMRFAGAPDELSGAAGGVARALATLLTEEGNDMEPR